MDICLEAMCGNENNKKTVNAKVISTKLQAQRESICHCNNIIRHGYIM